MPRPKVPDKIKKMKGTLKKIRVNDQQPDVDDLVAVPEPPDNLDELAREEWKRVATILFNVGVLSSLDLVGLAMYCSNWSEWIRANKVIEEEGWIITAPSGYPVKNPMVTIRDMAETKAFKWISQYGLSPASRANVAVDPKKKKTVKGFMD